MLHSNSYKKIVLVFITAALCIGFFVLLTFWNMNRQIKENNNAYNTLKNLYFLENTLSDIQKMETAQRGYTISGYADFISKYENGKSNIKKDIKQINSLTLSDSLRAGLRKTLFQLLNAKIENLDYAIDIAKKYSLDSAATYIKKNIGENLMERIRLHIANMENVDRKLLREANIQSNIMASRTKWQFGLLAVAFFVIIASNFITIRRDLRKRIHQDKILRYNSSLINSITDPVIAFDSFNKITSWNRFAQELYGWVEAEALGKKMDEFLSVQYINYKRKDITESIATKGSWKGEMIHSTKSGNNIYIQASISAVIDEANQPSGTVAIFTDITNKKAVEAKLRDITANLEQEVKQKVGELNNIFERITDAFIAVDKNWCYTYLNAKAAELHGKEVSQLVGKNIWEMNPSEVDTPFYKILHEAMKTKEARKVQLFSKRSDRWFEDIIYPSEDGLSIYYHDITDRKKAELDLQRAHEKINYHINHTPMAVVEMDNELNILQWTTKAEEIFGWTLEEVRLNKLNGINLMHADDIELISEQLKNISDVDIDANVFQNRNIRKDGTVIYCQWYNSVMKDDDGKVIGLMALVQDVTESRLTLLQLEEAEEKFRNLVEASMVGVYIIQDNRFEYINPYFADIFGYTQNEIIENFTITDMIVEEDKQIVLDNVEKRLDGREKSINYGFSAYRKNGDIVHVEVFGTKTFYKGKSAIIGMLLDTTERKKSLIKLEQSESDLKISNERFLLVAEATNDAVWDWDILNDVIWGNEPFQNIMQSGSEEKLNYNSFISRIHPDDSPSMLINHKDALKNKRTSLNEEFRFKMVDGTYRILYNRASILYNENGRAFRLLGAMQDITAQKMAQKHLLLEKQLSDSIINSLPGVFYLFNQSGQFIRWNENFEKVTDYTTREISGLHPLDLFNDEQKTMLKEKIQNVFISGEDNVEAELKTKNGTRIPYYFTGMLINYEGENCLMGVGIDISEKVLSQQQLIKSEENFRTLIEQASDGIFISDKAGDYVVVNNNACTLTGFTREELLQKNIRDLIDKNDIAQTPLKFEELSSGQIIISERNMVRKDGSTFMVEISAKQLKDGRFQGIVRDITERKKSEEILRDSEEKRRLIMNAALDAIITIDLDGAITFWNPQAENIFGWKSDEVMGKLLADVIIPKRLRNAEDRAMINYLNNEKNNALNKVIELNAINREESEFPVELTVLPISQHHEAFFCVFIRDITKRKNAEEELRISEHKYRLLFDQNPLPMWMISLPSKHFLDVNEAAIEFYGFSKTEFLSMNLKDIRPNLDHIDGIDIISTYKSGIHNTGIWEHKKKNGKVVKMNLITHDIIYQGKHAKLVLANDVTDKIEAEEKLKNSYGELRELATHLQTIRETERAHMAREIHDELGQQLTGLKMDIAWIGKKLKSESEEVKLRMAETLQLINTTVKTVRRIATQLRPSILDDLGIVATLEWQSEEFQKRSGIECTFSTNVNNINLPTDIATGFFRIFQESLTNVLRHSQATKVITQLLFKDNLVILNITDNGIGYNAAEIVNKKTLGLLGMKERTLMMNGSYEVSSKPGNGTKVIIVVPVQNLTL